MRNTIEERSRSVKPGKVVGRNRTSALGTHLSSAMAPARDLEEICAKSPLCRMASEVVIAVSPYGKDGVADCGDTLWHDQWPYVAGWCLARDVHDEAIRRGWARSKRERDDSMKAWKAIARRRGWLDSNVIAFPNRRPAETAR